SWGKVNVPIEREHYEVLRRDVEQYLSSHELFVSDLWAGADPSYRLNVRSISPSAWHTAFVNNMFIIPTDEGRLNFESGFTILHAPEFHADPDRPGTRSSTFIVLSFQDRTVLIGGTRYAGEMKKSIFSVLNYLLPLQGVLPMHCSANIGPEEIGRASRRERKKHRWQPIRSG